MIDFLPNIYPHEPCRQYSLQELLPNFNEQEHACAFIVVQLALLGYVAGVAYNYNKHKTIVTLSTTAISIASFVFGMLASSRVPGKEILDDLFNLILLKKPEYNHFQRCRNDALFNLDSQLPNEIVLITSAVAAGAIGASIYHGVNSLFAKKKLDSASKSRQSQLEEFGFKKA